MLFAHRTMERVANFARRRIESTLLVVFISLGWIALITIVGVTTPPSLRAAAEAAHPHQLAIAYSNNSGKGEPVEQAEFLLVPAFQSVGVSQRSEDPPRVYAAERRLWLVAVFLLPLVLVLVAMHPRE